MNEMVVLGIDGKEMTLEQVEALASLCDQQADALVGQGFPRQARGARRSAREWRQTASEMVVRQGR